MSDQAQAPAAVDPLQFLSAAEREILAAEYDDTLSEEPVNRIDEVHPTVGEEAPESVAAPEVKVDPEPAQAAEVAAPAVAEVAAEPAAEPAPAVVAPVPTAAPLLVMAAPEDADVQLAKIGTDKEALATQFDDGEITGAEFQKKLDALNKAERKIETAVNNAEVAQKMQVQQAQNLWNAECNSFMARPDAKVYTDKPDLFTEFNETVVAISKVPRNKTLTGTQILEKAHAMMRADMPDQFADAPAPKPAEKPLPKPRAELPPTIGGLPAADVTTASGGKYDSLDRLATTAPLEYQAKIAAMSELERSAYLRA